MQEELNQRHTKQAINKIIENYNEQQFGPEGGYNVSMWSTKDELRVLAKYLREACACGKKPDSIMNITESKPMISDLVDFLTRDTKKLTFKKLVKRVIKIMRKRKKCNQHPCSKQPDFCLEDFIPPKVKKRIMPNVPFDQPPWPCCGPCIQYTMGGFREDKWKSKCVQMVDKINEIHDEIADYLKDRLTTDLENAIQDGEREAQKLRKAERRTQLKPRIVNKMNTKARNGQAGFKTAHKQGDDGHLLQEQRLQEKVVAARSDNLDAKVLKQSKVDENLQKKDNSAQLKSRIPKNMNMKTRNNGQAGLKTMNKQGEDRRLAQKQPFEDDCGDEIKPQTKINRSDNKHLKPPITKSPNVKARNDKADEKTTNKRGEDGRLTNVQQLKDQGVAGPVELKDKQTSTNENGKDPTGPVKGTEVLNAEQIEDKDPTGPVKGTEVLNAEQIEDKDPTGPMKGTEVLNAEQIEDKDPTGPMKGTEVLDAEQIEDKDPTGPVKGTEVLNAEQIEDKGPTGPMKGTEVLIAEQIEDKDPNGPMKGTEVLNGEQIEDKDPTGTMKGTEVLNAEQIEDTGMAVNNHLQGTDLKQSDRLTQDIDEQVYNGLKRGNESENQAIVPNDSKVKKGNGEQEAMNEGPIVTKGLLSEEVSETIANIVNEQTQDLRKDCYNEALANNESAPCEESKTAESKTLDNLELNFDKTSSNIDSLKGLKKSNGEQEPMNAGTTVTKGLLSEEVSETITNIVNEQTQNLRNDCYHGVLNTNDSAPCEEREAAESKALDNLDLNFDTNSSNVNSINKLKGDQGHMNSGTIVIEELLSEEVSQTIANIVNEQTQDLRNECYHGGLNANDSAPCEKSEAAKSKAFDDLDLSFDMASSNIHFRGSLTKVVSEIVKKVIKEQVAELQVQCEEMGSGDLVLDECDTLLQDANDKRSPTNPLVNGQSGIEIPSSNVALSDTKFLVPIASFPPSTTESEITVDKVEFVRRHTIPFIESEMGISLGLGVHVNPAVSHLPVLGGDQSVTASVAVLDKEREDFYCNPKVSEPEPKVDSGQGTSLAAHSPTTGTTGEVHTLWKGSTAQSDQPRVDNPPREAPSDETRNRRPSYCDVNKSVLEQLVSVRGEIARLRVQVERLDRSQMQRQPPQEPPH